MNLTTDVIELIRFEDIIDHLETHKLNVEIRSFLQIYGKLAGLTTFGAKVTYYEKRLINRILSENEYPIID